MRNNALTICCGVCVAGAFGVFTRWMQDLTAFDEHGLYVRGNIWGAVLLVLCIAAAGAMLGAIWYLKNHEHLVSPAGFGAAHAGGGVIRRAAWLIIAAFMAVACFALLLTAGSSQYASLLRVLALLGLLADGQGGFFAHPHTPAALVFKGVQAHSFQVQGHLGAVFVSLLAEAVALAGGAEQNHSSFPPRLKYFSTKGFSSLRRNKIPFLISRVMGCTTSTRMP